MISRKLTSHLYFFFRIITKYPNLMNITKLFATHTNTNTNTQAAAAAVAVAATSTGEHAESVNINAADKPPIIVITSDEETKQ